jgi:hypothetical protein
MIAERANLVDDITHLPQSGYTIVLLAMDTLLLSRSG